MTTRKRTQPVRKTTKVEHGTPYTYRRWKCSCDECREAWRNYQREYRLRTGKTNTTRSGPMVVAAHGTVSKYNSGCRCEDCTEANRVTRAKSRARR